MRHGTAGGYIEGCRCDDWTEAHRLAARDYRRRKVEVAVPSTSDPGPVEAAVAAELAGLRAAAERPCLAQLALTMARLLDSPQAAHSKPAAAGRLVDILGRLHSVPVPGRRGKLAVVRAMSTAGDTPGAKRTSTE